MHPAKANGWNEMPFGSINKNNTVLGRGATGRGFGGQNPSVQECCLLPNYFGPCLKTISHQRLLVPSVLSSSITGLFIGFKKTVFFFYLLTICHAVD